MRTDMEAPGLERIIPKEAVLETIEGVSPRLVVCGHIHGCWGQRATLGSTPILNAGPDGHVLEV